MWVRNSGSDPVETETDFAVSWLTYLWVQGLGWEDMSLERINLLFRHWNGIQFPILPLSTSVPALSCCWIDNSTYSSPYLVRACTLPCTVCCWSYLSIECTHIIQITTVIPIIVGGGGPLQHLAPLLCTSKRWAEMLEVGEERVGIAWEGSQGE